MYGYAMGMSTMKRARLDLRLPPADLSVIRLAASTLNVSISELTRSATVSMALSILKSAATHGTRYVPSTGGAS